jgi:hypothetical protein
MAGSGAPDIEVAARVRYWLRSGSLIERSKLVVAWLRKRP